MSLFLSLKSDRKWLKGRLKLKQSRKPFAIYGYQGIILSQTEILATENPLKMMKNALYFILNYIFILKMLSWLFGHIEKRVKIRLISKLMSHSLGNKQFQYIYCPNNSRSKGNQTMQYVWLIDYDMSNIFLKNHTEKMVVKLFPDSFL